MGKVRFFAPYGVAALAIVEAYFFPKTLIVIAVMWTLVVCVLVVVLNHGITAEHQRKMIARLSIPTVLVLVSAGISIFTRGGS